MVNAARLVQAAETAGPPTHPITQGSTQGKESLGTCVCRPPPRPNPGGAARGSPSQPIAPRCSEAGAMRGSHQSCSSNSNLLRLFVFSDCTAPPPAHPLPPTAKYHMASHGLSSLNIDRRSNTCTSPKAAYVCVHRCNFLTFCTRAFARVAAQHMRPAALYGHGRLR